MINFKDSAQMKRIGRRFLWSTVALLAATLLLVRCANQSAKERQAAAQTAASAPYFEPRSASAPPPPPRPFYDLVDGYKYGYEPKLTSEEEGLGKRSAKLVMMSYNGERNGVHQVSLTESHRMIITAQYEQGEQFVKIMTFVNHKMTDKHFLRARPDMLAVMALEDAKNGLMQRQVLTVEGIKGYVFCWEDIGCRGEMLPKASSKAASS